MKRSDLMDAIQCAQGAMQNVLDNWESGDLAAAIRELKEVKENEIDPAVAWWESDDIDPS